MNKHTTIPLTSFKHFVCTAPKPLGDLGDQGFKALLGVTPLCNGREFQTVVRVKTYNGLLSQGETIIAQIPVFKCVACGAIYDLNTKP